MIFRICLLLSAVACYTSMALVYVERHRVGSRVRLYLRPREEYWVRERFGVAWEFIKHCGPYERGPHCHTFVTKDYKPSQPRTFAAVHADGALVIDPMQATDIGIYYCGTPNVTYVAIYLYFHVISF
ncbi:unnamed protein product [Heligmosomoides polygyrus]|uniref:Ig-like domain-containing protein n=1 Tax=Heligmosomoides polygyrus TaxID=6339 RepID=A0A183G5L8_HELPZ|nr:unnamed protein product [Heligmosomoides polygyrus]